MSVCVELKILPKNLCLRMFEAEPLRDGAMNRYDFDNNVVFQKNS